MQKINLFLRGISARATIVDRYNYETSMRPAIVIGAKIEIVIGIFQTENDDHILTEYESETWSFAADKDYLSETTPMITSSNILVDSNGMIHVILENTATESLLRYINSHNRVSIK